MYGANGYEYAAQPLGMYMLHSALSPEQLRTAQIFIPNHPSMHRTVTTLTDESLRDREIQEILTKEHNYSDYSPEGRVAYKINCRVIHNPSQYWDMPANNPLPPGRVRKSRQ